MSRAFYLRTILLASLLSVQFLHAQDPKSLAYIYERSGIKITVPEGYTVLKDSLFALWNFPKDRKDIKNTDIVGMFECCLESPDKSLWVLFPGIMNSLIKEGRDDRLDHPKRFASRELAKYYDNLDNGPYYVDDHMTCLSGKYVRERTNADIVYYYELPLKGYRLEHKDLTPALEVRDNYRFWRFYICKAGGYMMNFLVIDRTGTDDMIINHMDEVLSSIWFDSYKIREVWEIHK